VKNVSDDLLPQPTLHELHHLSVDLLDPGRFVQRIYETVFIIMMHG